LKASESLGGVTLDGGQKKKKDGPSSGKKILVHCQALMAADNRLAAEADEQTLV